MVEQPEHGHGEMVFLQKPLKVFAIPVWPEHDLLKGWSHVRIWPVILSQMAHSAPLFDNRLSSFNCRVGMRCCDGKQQGNSYYQFQFAIYKK